MIIDAHFSAHYFQFTVELTTLTRHSIQPLYMDQTLFMCPRHTMEAYQYTRWIDSQCPMDLSYDL